MSTPRTIGEYLGALNASLEVGLRSRRRILSEVEDHLCQATQAQLRCGAESREAQQLAIVEFGSPEQVAARFEAGLVGALDRRLALSVRCVHRWMSQHRFGVPVFAVVVSLLFGAAFAVVGAVFGRDALLAASAYLAAGTAFPMIWIVSRSFRRGLRDMTTNSMGSLLLPSLFSYPAVVGCLVLLGGDYSFTVRLGGFTLVYALLAVSQSLIERAINRAARRSLPPTEQDRRQAWRADHPWQSALAGVAPLPLGLVTLIAVYPGPAALRVALVVLVAAMTVLAAVAVQLESARREREAYRREFVSEPT